MNSFRALLISALAVLAFAGTARSQADQDRRELMTLYFASIAADRCEFPITEPEADKLIQTAVGLQKKLGMKEEEADRLYEEVELTFEKKLPDACKKDGDAFKSYEQVMQTLRKK